MNSLTLGWELEVECVSAPSSEHVFEEVDALTARYMAGVLREVKDDCSLIETSAEIVSEPLTFEQWVAIKPSIDGLLAALSACKYRSWDGNNCGLHIHVGRRTTTARSLERMFDLIYDNTAYWMRESGRRRFHYCPFDEGDAAEHKKEIPYAMTALTRDETFHNGIGRTAVHLSCHNTVEFRFWRGTLNAARFWRSLEATHAICSYAADSVGDVSLDEYHEYVSTNALRYPTLSAHHATLMQGV